MKGGKRRNKGTPPDDTCTKQKKIMTASGKIKKMRVERKGYGEKKKKRDQTKRGMQIQGH